ncbi:MAG: cysteine desulfurase [Saprospiraceae bacterium]|nr:cysteine desulfurase [Saprospiraceae bacterium]
MRIYFDNASTTPLLPEVVETMHELMEINYGNPSSIHLHGRQARSSIEAARKTIANVINASIGEVFFTSCATETHNFFLTKAVEEMGRKVIIYSAIEHHCIFHTAEHLKEVHGIETIVIPVDHKGHLDYGVLENALKATGTSAVVSIMHGNNEIGVINDLKRISHLCRENGALFHCDTVQTIGKLPIDVQEVDVDCIAGSAHKFFGPKGIGFMYLKNDIKLSPIFHGGSQERNMRSGTENIYGICGMAKALEMAHQEMSERKDKVTKIKQHFINRLQELEDIKINGSEDGLYHILNVSFPAGPKADLIMFNLDIMGISASSGSACSSGIELDSHVLQAIGHPAGRKAVRFSFSHFNTIEEVDHTIEQLKTITPALV